MEKNGGKGSVFFQKESVQMGCVSQDSREQIKPSNSRSAPDTKSKFGRERAIARYIKKCELHERNPCAPRFEEKTQDETLRASLRDQQDHEVAIPTLKHRETEANLPKIKKKKKKTRSEDGQQLSNDKSIARCPRVVGRVHV